MKRAIVCLGVALFLVGCANQTDAAPQAGEAMTIPAPSGFLNAGPVLRLVKSQELRGGERFDPPPQSASPSISAAAAYAKCQPIACGTSQAPTVELVDFSLPAGVGAAKHGPIVGRLAYVFAWKDEVCSGNGPVHVVGKCYMWFVVDAVTGEPIDAVTAGSAYVSSALSSSPEVS